MGAESDAARFFVAQLFLPVEDSRPIGGGFGFGDQSFFMQSDGQGGERKRIVGFELHQSLADRYGFVEAVQLLQCARESVQGLRVLGIQRQTLLIFRNGFFILTLRKQIETSLKMCICRFGIGAHLASVSMVISTPCRCSARCRCPNIRSPAPQMQFVVIRRVTAAARGMTVTWGSKSCGFENRVTFALDRCDL